MANRGLHALKPTSSQRYPGVEARPILRSRYADDHCGVLSRRGGAVATGPRRPRLPSARLDGVMSLKTACEGRRSWKPLTLKCIPQQHHHVGHLAFVPSSRTEPSRGGAARRTSRSGCGVSSAGHQIEDGTWNRRVALQRLARAERKSCLAASPLY